MTTMDVETLGALRRTLRGVALRPDDHGFAEATFLWNAMIDRTPALVVQAADTADVVAAVDFARRQDVPVAVRGGGHNIAGTALAHRGVTIDMSRLRGRSTSIRSRRVATVQPGCLLGDVDRATQRARACRPRSGSSPRWASRG